MRLLLTSWVVVVSGLWGLFGDDTTTAAPKAEDDKSTTAPTETEETTAAAETTEPTDAPASSETTEAPPASDYTSPTPAPAPVATEPPAPVEEEEHRDSNGKRTAKYPIGDCRGTQETYKECKLDDCAVHCTDCEWDEWSEWSACMCDGLKERSRVIKVANNQCGKVCEGNLVETATCTPSCMPALQNCRLSEWSGWDKCDKQCGSGQQFQSRTVDQRASKKGIPCDGDLRKTQQCATEACDNSVNCKLSPWSPWEKCSRSCGNGQQQRTRHIEIPASAGIPCDAPLQEIRGCNEKGCGGEIDCVWDDWQSWGACSRSCGGGQKNRNRIVKVSPRAGGKLCSAQVTTETILCNEEPCTAVTDCVIGPWSAWDACSCTANGIRRRNRQIERYPEEGGKGCSGSLKEVEGCNLKFETPNGAHIAAPRDCVLGSWDHWSSCSATCGIGAALRRRNVAVEPVHGGKPCEGSLNEVKGCDAGSCIHTTTTTTEAPTSAPTLPHEKHAVIDCKWSEWDSWSACSATCGGGERNRLRQITQMCNVYGEPCDYKSSMEMEACGTQSCGCTDCAWAEWGEWSPCTCTGLQEAHRHVKVHMVGMCKPCVGPKVKTKECHPDCERHPDDCEWGEWTKWGACTAECGGGQEKRHRSIKKPPAEGGRPCVGPSKEAIACNTRSCSVSEDCEFGDWSSWGECPVTCGGGEQKRARSIKATSVDGGHGCKGAVKEMRGCGTESCIAGKAQDCKWGSWSTFGACSATCGGGTKQRDRSIAQAPRHMGKLCEAKVKSEIVACSTQSCSGKCIDAVWAGWEPWSKCSATCGSAYRSRTRTVAQQANDCGKNLEGTFQEYAKCDIVDCSSAAAKVDCEFSPWTDWNDCSCSCDGVKDKSRRVAKYAENGGKPCEGALKVVTHCNVGKCDITKSQDCELGPWSHWDPCTQTCNGGVQTRRRVVNTAQSGNGKPCDNVLKEVKGCNFVSCSGSVDCEFGEWTTWSDCTKKCGGGQRNRYRHIQVLPENDGKACPLEASSETQGCNAHRCGHVAFCAWAGWSAWGECSATCGYGTQKRKRHLDIMMTDPGSGNALGYGILNEMFTMNEQASEKLLGAFIAGLCIAGLTLSFVHRVLRRGFAYSELSRDVE